MTLPEVLLYQQFQQQNGVKFRRQHSIENYTLDFYCAKAKVAVEIDGISHDMGDRPQRDPLRDAALQKLGIETIRIPATDVLKSPAYVAEALVRHCERR